MALRAMRCRRARWCLSVVFIVGCIIEEREEKYKRERTMGLEVLRRMDLENTQEPGNWPSSFIFTMPGVGAEIAFLLC
ncbi:MAG TPA: hypothetical protein VF903_10005, partial [Nitrospirota bacterium]